MKTYREKMELDILKFLRFSHFDLPFYYYHCSMELIDSKMIAVWSKEFYVLNSRNEPKIKLIFRENSFDPFKLIYFDSGLRIAGLFKEGKSNFYYFAFNMLGACARRGIQSFLGS